MERLNRQETADDIELTPAPSSALIPGSPFSAHEQRGTSSSASDTTTNMSVASTATMSLPEECLRNSSETAVATVKSGKTFYSVSFNIYFGR